jgi:hypothetical protein
VNAGSGVRSTCDRIKCAPRDVGWCTMHIMSNDVIGRLLCFSAYLRALSLWLGFSEH